LADPRWHTCHAVYDDGVLRITSTGGPAVLAIAGDIDEHSYAGLVETLRKVTDGHREIHINLGDVTYCDLAGLRAIILLAGRGDHEPAGPRLVLHEVPQQLKTLLQILGWDSTPGLVLPEPDQHRPPARGGDRALTPADHPARPPGQPGRVSPPMGASTSPESSGRSGCTSSRPRPSAPSCRPLLYVTDPSGRVRWGHRCRW
jgi:anti-anti-sigma regulatory factor